MCLAKILEQKEKDINRMAKKVKKEKEMVAEAAFKVGFIEGIEQSHGNRYPHKIRCPHCSKDIEFQARF